MGSRCMAFTFLARITYAIKHHREDTRKKAKGKGKRKMNDRIDEEIQTLEREEK